MNKFKRTVKVIAFKCNKNAVKTVFNPENFANIVVGRNVSYKFLINNCLVVQNVF